MPERRYSDDEVKRILSNAVDSDAALSESTAERGMTLAEIESIAVEAGLTPASVRAAATSLDQHVQLAPKDSRMLGMRVGVGQSVVLPRTLTDTEWRRLVVLMRDLFQATGREQEGAGRREWRNGNLRISLETLGEGAVLQMRTRKANATSLMGVGVAMFAGGAVMEGTAQLTRGDPHAAASAMVFVLGGALMTAISAIDVRGWSGRRQAQFQEIADYARQLSAAESDETSVTR